MAQTGAPVEAPEDDTLTGPDGDEQEDNNPVNDAPEEGEDA